TGSVAEGWPTAYRPGGTMNSIRPMPQRALQAPKRSPLPSSVAMRGTGPAGVSSHAMKPGTLSVINPPPLEVGGPQHGGLSVSLSASPEQHEEDGVHSASVFFRMLLILKGPVAPFFTCNMQLLLPAGSHYHRPWPLHRSAVPAT